MIEVGENDDGTYIVVIEGLMDESRTTVTLEELAKLYDALWPIYEKEVIHGV